MISTSEHIKQLGAAARSASSVIANSSTKSRDQALYAIAELLTMRKQDVMAANASDIAAARKKNLTSALLDRLTINDKVFNSMIEGLHQVAKLDDVVGKISNITQRPSGIQVGKMRVPLGVVALIYESRPNVTIEASSLCIKSGNAAILRGGSESFHSNKLLAEIVQAGIVQAGFDASTISVVETTDRDAVDHLITMDEYIDVVIPRGGKGLIERISNKARVPVIKHLDGVCHVYIDKVADQKKAVDIAVNAKTHRYGVCNAMETLLLHQSIATDFLPIFAPKIAAKQVEVRACPHASSLLNDYQPLIAATEDDWYAEYLAPIVAIKVVNSLQEAITHINHYGSHHTDAIVTNDYDRARAFLRQVDSSSVIVNASTRFADGFEYGLGAEIGISTNKIHARGPVGLEGLTSEKYIVLGNGEVRE